MLLARLFKSLPLVCPNGGTNMRIIALITEATRVARILDHVGELPELPRISQTPGSTIRIRSAVPHCAPIRSRKLGSVLLSVFPAITA